MIQFSTEMPKILLALSLHAPNQSLRAALLPSAREFQLEELMRTVDEVTSPRPGLPRGGIIQIEYVVLDGVNDSDTHVREIGQLLSGRRVYVSNASSYSLSVVLHVYEC